MAHKHIILYSDSLANECVRRDFASASHECVFLNLDEGSDLGFVSHCTAVEVDQIRLEDLHFVA
jgi:hypothetical protein